VGVEEGDAVAVAVRVCVGIGVELGGAVRVGVELGVGVRVSVELDDGLRVGDWVAGCDGVPVRVALGTFVTVLVGLWVRVGSDVAVAVTTLVGLIVGVAVASPSGVSVVLAVTVGVVVVAASSVAVAVGISVVLGVAVPSDGGDAVGVMVMLAVLMRDGELVGRGVSVPRVAEAEADADAVAVAVAVVMGVGVISSVGALVGLGVAGQPRKAAFTARTRSSTVTRPSSLESAAAQLLSGACDSAMRTALTSSSMLTTLLPLQSPGHAADAAALHNDTPPTSASTRHIETTLPKIAPQSSSSDQGTEGSRV
jgi:hypothetical protein